MSKAPKDGGFIKLWRAYGESRIWRKPPIYSRIFTWILMEATHEPKPNLPPGIVATNIGALSEGVAWYENRKKVKPHKQMVSRVLEWLVAEEMIQMRPGLRDAAKTALVTELVTVTLVISVCNWRVYQGGQGGLVTGLVTDTKNKKERENCARALEDSEKQEDDYTALSPHAFWYLPDEKLLPPSAEFNAGQLLDHYRAEHKRTGFGNANSIHEVERAITLLHRHPDINLTPKEVRMVITQWLEARVIRRVTQLVCGTTQDTRQPYWRISLGYAKDNLNGRRKPETGKGRAGAPGRTGEAGRSAARPRGTAGDARAKKRKGALAHLATLNGA